MILYKYLPLESAIAMLENSSLSFSQIGTFNDPTEATAAEYYDPNLPFDDLVWPPRSFVLNMDYAVCCLTRNDPLTNDSLVFSPSVSRAINKNYAI